VKAVVKRLSRDPRRIVARYRNEGNVGAGEPAAGAANGLGLGGRSVRCPVRRT
jgi:hypothetical protein